MATITTLAFVSMVSSVVIAELTQGVATAINQAGSLRMQSYRIASSLAHLPNSKVESETQWKKSSDLVEEFESRLVHSRLVSVLSDNLSHAPSSAYAEVKQEWFEMIKPLLKRYLSATNLAHQQTQTFDANIARVSYLEVVDPFVAKIHHMVKLLENEAESKIRLLRLIHISSLFLTLLIAFTVMYLMKTRVQTPLYDLLDCAERTRHGDFSKRTPYIGDDELGQLGTAFNEMANDLSKMYTDLEERVNEKTSDLERSNRSLELLYNTTKTLNAAPISDEIYNELLNDIQNLLDVGPGSICLTGQDPERAFRMASTRNPDENVPDICNPPNCPTCFGDGKSHCIKVQRGSNDLLCVHSTPILHQDQHYGVLLTEIPKGKELKAWQKRLLEAVANHIGIAIDVTQRTNEGRRLMLLEERSVIARELHDSLAQSLSYLKIQITRLKLTLEQPDGYEKIKLIIDDMKSGTNSAYLQLRELLTTFRLKMDGGGLSTALSDTVKEFTNHSGIPITLNNRLDKYLIDASEEIHILHVVREALSNVVRHSDAKSAQVRLNFDTKQNIISVIIDDDGIGICKKAERVNHYGLAIMSERANGLGGEINVACRDEGGTRVLLKFQLQHRDRDNRRTLDPNNLAKTGKIQVTG
ncbi:MAG: histidine kinase [Candidatus Polarisedimenticolaceae bacterium]|nr:histidine kinase [Candidatus Polarisedimenticolaceae bacterium]